MHTVRSYGTFEKILEVCYCMAECLGYSTKWNNLVTKTNKTVCALLEKERAPGWSSTYQALSQKSCPKFSQKQITE